KETAAREQKSTATGTRSGNRAREIRPAYAGHQQAAAVQRSTAPSSRNDIFEREANAAASSVSEGRAVSADKLSAAQYRSIQAFDWEWCNPFTDPDCGISSTAQVVAGETAEIASEVWDEAKALAKAVGGFLSY